MTFSFLRCLFRNVNRSRNRSFGATTTYPCSRPATVAGLEQGYVVVAPKDRFRLLFTFLKRHRKKEKVMVFFSSCNAVKYYSDLLNYVDVPVLGRRPV